jgi:hypothetical protein
LRPRLTLLYEDPAASELEVEEVAAYLSRVTGSPVEVRPEFIGYHYRGELESLARSIASARVRDPSRPWTRTEPLFGEVEFELRALRDPRRVIPGVLYDALEVMAIVRSLIPPPEANLDHLHVVFTRRLLGSFDGEDRRYHARTILAGYPCLISTSGLVEAPAKPREFYLRRRGAAALKVDLPAEVLKEGLLGRFLEYGDPRTTEVAKGYALQAYAYHALGDPFCALPECRLYNAHWQEEMLAAQVSSGEVCERHRRALGGSGSPGGTQDPTRKIK